MENLGQLGQYLGAGLACIGMAFAEALGIFSFLVALLLLFAV